MALPHHPLFPSSSIFWCVTWSIWKHGHGAMSELLSGLRVQVPLQVTQCRSVLLSRGRKKKCVCVILRGRSVSEVNVLLGAVWNFYSGVWSFPRDFREWEQVILMQRSLPLAFLLSLFHLAFPDILSLSLSLSFSQFQSHRCIHPVSFSSPVRSLSALLLWLKFSICLILRESLSAQVKGWNTF